MLRTLTVLVMLASIAPSAVVIDRIAVVVGKHVIKLSDIDREIRVTDFLNRQPLVENAQTKRSTAERLIDQQIIRNAIATGGYGRASDDDADAMLRQIRQSRFAGSDVRLKQALAQYRLTEAELHAELLWQLTVLRFIDQRFRPGVLITDEQIRAYYDQHAELKKVAYQTAAPEIRKTLEGEQVNEQFDSWLSEIRKLQQIRFLEGAFQ
jgi:peptidyl-prolyl cis-trans isomerase SurA